MQTSEFTVWARDEVHRPNMIWGNALNSGAGWPLGRRQDTFAFIKALLDVGL